MFTIIKSGLTLDFKEFIFPAGEVSVKLNAQHYAYKNAKGNQNIIARIQNSDDLIKLAMIKNALQKIDNAPIDLFLPYVPYARQDRVCDKGEAFSIVVFAKFIASLKFNQVTIVDPHSDVTPAVFEALDVNLKVIRQFDVINKYLDFSLIAGKSLLVSPDTGANKKTSEIAGYFNHTEFVRADKLRDLSNGQIKETIVYCDDLKGRDVVIIDDLCERGGTFLLLAKALKAKNCGKVYLYVTHGVFGNTEATQVINNLLSNGIDKIFTTNSYHHNLKQDEKVEVLNLEEKFLVDEINAGTTVCD